VLMAASENMELLKAHGEDLQKIKSITLRGPTSSKKVLFAALAQQDLQVVYFYCHGLRAPDIDGTVLEIGSKSEPDYIRPKELTDYKLHWHAKPPLVFLNGCHTVDTGPEDLGSFNRSLRSCGAAGVVGTEIDVHERLAKTVGERFVEDFLVDRKNLGETIRRLRLLLLLKGNPLGLIYTPYGYSDLQVGAA